MQKYTMTEKILIAIMILFSVLGVIACITGLFGKGDSKLKHDNRTGKVFQVVDGKIAVSLPVEAEAKGWMTYSPKLKDESSIKVVYNYDERGLLQNTHKEETDLSTMFVYIRDEEDDNNGGAPVRNDIICDREYSYTEGYRLDEIKEKNNSELFYNDDGTQIKSTSKTETFSFMYDGDTLINVRCADDSGSAVDYNIGKETGLIESATYNSGDTVTSSFSYNDAGNLDKITHDCNESGMFMVKESSFDYDEKNRIVNADINMGETFFPSYSLAFEYDDAKRQITVDDYNEQRDGLDYVYCYDDEGRISEFITYYDTEEGMAESHDVFTYDRWGRCFPDYADVSYEGRDLISYKEESDDRYWEFNIKYKTFYIEPDLWDYYLKNYYYTYRWLLFNEFEFVYLTYNIDEDVEFIAQNEGYESQFRYCSGLLDSFIIDYDENIMYAWLYFPKIIDGKMLRKNDVYDVVGPPAVTESVTTTDNITEAVTSDENRLDEEAFKEARKKERFASYLESSRYGSLPDGTQLEVLDTSEVYSTYAIYDVDGDGREELIIFSEDACMAGMLGLVYDYNPDTDTMTRQYLGFPSMAFYSNGAIKQNISHNQGYGPNFWPFDLYAYDRDSDTYICAGSVETWEKSAAEVNAYTGEVFPDDKDLDGDGVVYYCYDGTEGSGSIPRDKADYEAWYSSVIGDAVEVELPWHVLERGCTDESWVKPYINMLMDRIESVKTTETDLGLIFMQSGGNCEAVNQKLIDDHGLALTEDDYVPEISEGTIDGKNVYWSTIEDGTGFTYKNELIDNISVLGIYPGMSEEEAIKCLNERGFNKNDRECYVTGESFGNFEIYLNIDNGIVTGVSMFNYCRYAG